MKVEEQQNIHPDIARIYELIIEGIKQITNEQTNTGGTKTAGSRIRSPIYDESLITYGDTPSGFIDCKPQEWSAYHVLLPPDVVKVITDFKNFP